MQFKKITIDQLPEYVVSAFKDDNEILSFYDKNVFIEKWEDAAVSVIKKINEKYYDSDFYGIENNGEKVGYFVKTVGLLVSFCLQKELRNSDNLKELWSKITSEINGTFNCVLYSKNSRAINWLKKCGMEMVMDDVTIFYYDNKKINICQQ